MGENEEKEVPLSEVFRKLQDRGLRPIDYKDLPYSALRKLAELK